METEADFPTRHSSVGFRVWVSGEDENTGFWSECLPSPFEPWPPLEPALHWEEKGRGVVHMGEKLKGKGVPEN